jgi:hypothetical protein
VSAIGPEIAASASHARIEAGPAVDAAIAGNTNMPVPRTAPT